MNPSPRRMPPAVRAIAETITSGVAAARAQDEEALGQASAKLATQDDEQVRLVFGALVRSVVEERFPDGLTGDDVGDLLREVVTSSAGWFGGLDVGVLIVVLTGALGVHDVQAEVEEDETPPPPPAVPDVVRHASLVMVALTDPPDDGEPEAGVRSRVDAVLTEMSQTQPEEMP